MATSSKHDHKNVGCHRISLQLRSGDRVLATIRTPAEIDKSPQRKAPARLGRVARVSERVPVQALASRRPPISEPAPRPTSRRRLGSERPRNPAGTLTGGPPSSGPPGERSSSDKPSSDKPPNLGPARTLADIKEETEAGISYQPCPANVRFPNGQQMCLGLSGISLLSAVPHTETALVPPGST